MLWEDLILLFIMLISTMGSKSDDPTDDNIINRPYVDVSNRDRSRWVDPYDVKIVHSPKSVLLSDIDLSKLHEKNHPGECHVCDAAFLPHFKRYIIDLLSKLELKLTSKETYFTTHTETKHYNARIVFKKYQMDVLNDILLADRLDAKMLQESLDVLSNLLQDVYQGDETFYSSSTFLVLTSFLSSWTMIYTEALLLLFFLLKRLRRRSWCMIICCTVLFIFCCSVLQTWYRLIKEKEVENMSAMYKNFTEECSTDRNENIGFFNYVLMQIKRPFLFSEPDRCTEYHKKLLIAPFLHVTLLQAISAILTDAFLMAVKLFGPCYALFVNDVFRNIPVTLWLPALLLLGFLFTISLLLFLGYKINFLYGLFRFEPSDQNERLIRSVLSEQRTELIPHRSDCIGELRTSDSSNCRCRLDKSKSKSYGDLRLTSN